MEQATKSASVSFRVSPLFKRCLEEAAAREQRSQTNMLEKLVLDYCRAHSIAGLTEEPTSTDAPREGKHGYRVARR
jgi:protein tyrosine phosphatase (PTP) superfamily phosphohydrolase (DUF442 family)